MRRRASAHDRDDFKRGEGSSDGAMSEPGTSDRVGAGHGGNARDHRAPGQPSFDQAAEASTFQAAPGSRTMTTRAFAGTRDGQ